MRINDRFFKGGTTFRGFQTAGIGPRDTSSTPESALGGKFYAIGIGRADGADLPARAVRHQGRAVHRLRHAGPAGQARQETSTRPRHPIIDPKSRTTWPCGRPPASACSGPRRWARSVSTSAKCWPREDYDKTETFRFSTQPGSRTMNLQDPRRGLRRPAAALAAAPSALAQAARPGRRAARRARRRPPRPTGRRCPACASSPSESALGASAVGKARRHPHAAAARPGAAPSSAAKRPPSQTDAKALDASARRCRPTSCEQRQALQARANALKPRRQLRQPRSCAPPAEGRGRIDQGIAAPDPHGLPAARLQRAAERRRAGHRQPGHGRHPAGHRPSSNAKITHHLRPRAPRPAGAPPPGDGRERPAPGRRRVRPPAARRVQDAGRRGA